MIIWIASYPKSGNTWLRSLLSDYKNFSDQYSFEETIYTIKQFPSHYHFDFLINEGMVDNSEKFKDVSFASKYWVIAQRRLLMENQKDVLLKTHGAPCRIGENYFITDETTRCAICLIRDPRQVLFSLMKHYNLKTQKEGMEFMLRNDKSFNVSLNDKYTKFSSLPKPAWDIYYFSWEVYQNLFPILFVKYEDMFKCETFNKIIKFLQKNSDDEDFVFDEKKTKAVFERSNFDSLKKKEIKSGFKETLKSKNFFNEGKTNTWQDKILPEIKENLEKKFEKLMKQFNYL